MKTLTNRGAAYVALFSVALAGVFAACNSDDTNPNPQPVTSSVTSTTTGGATTTTASTTGGGGSSATTTTTTTTTATTGGAGGAGGGGDCFKGSPTKNEEFLNACTNADCSKFSTPLPLLKADGSLPPLP